MIEWETWDGSLIRRYHGDVFGYRKLYDGDHAELFPRAKQLLNNKEAYDSLRYNEKGIAEGNVKAPYIIANVAKVIAEVPAMFVSRSMGKIKTSITSTEEQNETDGAADDMIEGPDDDETNNEITDLPQEMIDQITKNSRLSFKHWQNVVQHQTDGGLVGVPFLDDRGLRIEFKMRDVYYPHEDEMGVDLAFHKEIGDDQYLHVYRERIEVERVGLKRNARLVTSNMMYKLEGTRLELLKEEEAKRLLNMTDVKQDV